MIQNLIPSLLANFLGSSTIPRKYTFRFFEFKKLKILIILKEWKKKSDRNALRRREGQCRRRLDSNSARTFLGIKPPLFGLLHALPGAGGSPNGNHRVGAATADSANSDSPVTTVETDPPPLLQLE